MSLAIVNDPKLGSKLGDDSPQATTDPGFAGLHLPFKVKAITLETHDPNALRRPQDSPQPKCRRPPARAGH
jgi:hypothetical protein